MKPVKRQGRENMWQGMKTTPMIDFKKTNEQIDKSIRKIADELSESIKREPKAPQPDYHREYCQAIDHHNDTLNELYRVKEEKEVLQKKLDNQKSINRLLVKAFRRRIGTILKERNRLREDNKTLLSSLAEVLSVNGRLF